jgi:hypothetical protein
MDSFDRRNESRCATSSDKGGGEYKHRFDFPCWYFICLYLLTTVLETGSSTPLAAANSPIPRDRRVEEPPQNSSHNSIQGGTMPKLPIEAMGLSTLLLVGLF